MNDQTAKVLTGEPLTTAVAPAPQLPTVVGANGPVGIAKIAVAISAIMGEIGVVGKDGYNKFHQYNYAKMEDILQQLTPLMAKHGLVVFQTEIDRAMFDADGAVAVRYAFTICHSSGEVWPDRPVQTGLSRCRDSKGGFDDKSFNKAHTAARKYFLLALFQIPTDDDADKGENEAPRKTLPKKDAKEIYTKLQTEMDAVPSYDELKQWGGEARERIEVLPGDWQEHLRLRFAERLVDLRQHQRKAAAEPASDIPNAATEPEKFLAWAGKAMAAAVTQEALELAYNAFIEPHATGLFPPDKAELVAIFGKNEIRLAS